MNGNLAEDMNYMVQQLYVVERLPDEQELEKLSDNDVEKDFFNYESKREVKKMYKRFFGNDYKQFM